MAKYTIIAADTKHFLSLYADYKKDMRVITPAINNCIVELENDNDFVTIYNGELTPPEYLKHLR